MICTLTLTHSVVEKGLTPPSRSTNQFTITGLTTTWNLFLGALAFSVLVAKPKRCAEEASNAFICALKSLPEHPIEKGIFADPRDDVLAFAHDEWEQALHPNLSSLAGMMEQLATHGLLTPPPLQDHLHEAFRRVLLNQIPSMDDDVPLTANVSRNSSPRCTGPSRPEEAPSSEYNIPVGLFEKA